MTNAADSAMNEQEVMRNVLNEVDHLQINGGTFDRESKGETEYEVNRWSWSKKDMNR